MKKSSYQVIGSLLMMSAVMNVHAGDAEAGKSVYSSMGCVACHGEGGNSMVPTFPTLAGLEAEVIINQLKGFRSGEVDGTTMPAMAASLTDEQIENLAAYLSSQ